MRPRTSAKTTSKAATPLLLDAMASFDVSATVTVGNAVSIGDVNRSGGASCEATKARHLTCVAERADQLLLQA